MRKLSLTLLFVLFIVSGCTSCGKKYEKSELEKKLDESYEKEVETKDYKDFTDGDIEESPDPYNDPRLEKEIIMRVKLYNYRRGIYYA